MIPAKFKKLLVALEYLIDKQTKDVEKFLKGDNLFSQSLPSLSRV